jgi:hypothetical protein
VIDANTGAQMPSDSHYQLHDWGWFNLPAYGSGTWMQDEVYMPLRSTPMRVQTITQYSTLSGFILETDFVTTNSYTLHFKKEYSGFTNEPGTYGSCSQ